MSELNGKKYQIKTKGPYTFEINEDTTKFGAYKTGGYATQVKLAVTHKFVSVVTFNSDDENTFYEKK
jgi:hypothetical protein